MSHYRRVCRLFRGQVLLPFILLLLASPALVDAQEARRDSSVRRDTLDQRPRYSLAPLIVTATRAARESSELAAPVASVDSAAIRRANPNSASDLFRDLAGLDVSGVGPSQTRPIIRGQKGQRILLLDDGLRMNNSRRQQDFGELPALLDVNTLSRVEVVRGPASVLYGSDAIGGVVNLISDAPPPLSSGDLFGGQIEYGFQGQGSQHQPSGKVFGRAGGFGYTASGTFRDADPYLAPAGTFGQVTLSNDALVNDTGVQDRNLTFGASYDFDSRHSISARLTSYDAEDAGFGFVSNDDLGTVGDPTIQILYPKQETQRLTLGYSGSDLGSAVADRVDFKGYYSRNQREFDLNVFIPFSPQAPESGVSVVTDNFTDIETLGFRLEAAKLFGDRVVVTYGTDYFNDDSENTDRSVSMLVGAGPPTPEVNEAPLVPNADYSSIGVFAQGDVQIHDRVSLIAGGRFQGVSAQTRETPGSDALATDYSDNTFVAAANLLVGLTETLGLAVNVGRGFRAPNLIELFFEGPTPEGSGFQLVNPELVPETSLNVDLGLKFETRDVAAEVFFFRNNIDNGIRVEPTGDMVGPFVEFRNVNVDEIRFQGVEIAAEGRPTDALAIGGSVSWLDAKDVLDPTNPIGESYGFKLTSHVRYVDPGARFWGEYRLRHNGESRDGQAISGPVGEVLPAFTVHDARAGVRLFTRGRVRTDALFGVTNITNELYAEAANASFFRPQPRRAVQAGLSVSF